MSIAFHKKEVLDAAFGENKVDEGTKQHVHEVLINGLEEKVKMEGLELKMKKGVSELLILKVNIHVECTLLAYHIQHPNIVPY